MDDKFKKNFIKGSLATSAGTMASMLFHFISIMIITRQISKEEFGIYALIIVIANFLNIISSLGLELSLVKFVASAIEREKKSTLVPTLILRAIFIIIFSVLVIFFGDILFSLFSFTASDFLHIIIFLFILDNLRSLFFNLLQGMNLFKKYALIQIITSILRVALLLIIIYADDLTLKNVLYIEIGVAFLTVALQIIFAKYKDILRWDVTAGNIKRIIKFSAPIYMNSILTFIYNQVNVFIIGAYLNPVSIASYDVAGKIPTAGKKGFNSFIVVFYPSLSKLFSKGEHDNAINLMNKSLFTISTIINVVLLISFLFNKEIIQLLFSIKYLDSSLVFSFLMVSFFLNSMSNIMGYSLVSAGFPASTLRVGVISSILSLSGALIMVPIWGIMGAVYSIIIARFSSVLFHYLYLIKYNLKIAFTNLIKPSSITISALIIYYLFTPDVFIYKALLTIGYLVAVYFFMPEAKMVITQILKHLLKVKKNKL